MKKFLAILVAVCAVYFSQTANAGIFFGARGGFEKYLVDSTDLHLDNGKTDYMAGGFLGYHTGLFRLEAEYLYHPKRLYRNFYRTESQTVMGNLYFSPALRTIVHPYIMGGAGVAFHSMTIDSSREKDNVFAWQAGIGLEMEFSRGVFFDVGGRWIDMGSPEHKKVKVDTTGYSYYLGLRFEY